MPVRKKSFRKTRRRGTASLAFVLAWANYTASQSLAGDDTDRWFRLTSEVAPDEESRIHSTDRKPWHFEFGFRESYPKLAETRRILDQRLNGPLTFDVLDFFDEPETPIDRKSDFLLTTFYVGAGRQESDWLVWTLYVGGGVGRDHDHQRVGIVNLEASFKYAYVFTGATAEIYPWRVPRREDFEDWRQRLSASRPFLTTGFETGYLSAEGRGNWNIAPLPRMYQDKVQVRDWITSLNLGLGWHLPISRSWSIVLMGDYRFHFYRPDEYNGWTLTTALRYNLS